MTLELTPTQRDHLRAAVAYKHADLENAVRKLAFGHTATFAEGKAKLTEIESLLSLLNVPHTTIILHQP